jgi:hypothetical protein
MALRDNALGNHLCRNLHKSIDLYLENIIVDLDFKNKRLKSTTMKYP